MRQFQGENALKILVAIKRVIDYKAVIRIKADGTDVETANVKMSINPFDEIALEAALRFKEQGIATEIIVLSIGTDIVQDVLRSALAMGADRAILVKTAHAVEPLVAAKILKQIVLKEAVQCVILGKQAIDTDNNQVGQMLAGLLQWSQGTFASKIDFHNEGVSVTREIDGGLQTLFLTLPTVITTDLRLNEPRYITLPNIMKAKSKPLAVLPVEELQIDIQPHINTLKVSAPQKRRAGVRVKNVAELVKRLKEEAQVL